MEDTESNSGVFMVDESDRPMTRVELLRMIKEQPPPSQPMPSNGSSGSGVSSGGGRRRKKS